MPTQMVAHLRFISFPTNLTDVAYSGHKNFYDGQYRSSVVAIRVLEHVLRTNPTNVTLKFPRGQKRQFPYRVQSHSNNDDYLFFTNILPIEVESIPFNITVDFDRGTYRYVPGGPNYVHFEAHHTLKALDDSNKTCWCPNRTVRRGEFFAVDFLRIQSNLHFLLVLGSNFTLRRNIDMRISFDGVEWESCTPLERFPSKVQGPTVSGETAYSFNASLFPANFQVFRSVGSFATRAIEKFHVCDVRLLSA